jgi:FMN-dependent NADH-azoreductase
MTRNILLINAGANHPNSVTRPLADKLIGRLMAAEPSAVTTLELSEGVPLVDGSWIAGVYGEADFPAALSAKNASDTYVDQLLDADVLVITSPIYNFGVPAAFKAWIDQVARAGRTFRYTGPGQMEGLVDGVTAYVVVAGGGVSLGDELDHATPYLRQVLGFLGITDVHFIDATGVALDPEGAVARATRQLEALAVAG